MQILVAALYEVRLDLQQDLIAATNLLPEAQSFEITHIVRVFPITLLSLTPVSGDVPGPQGELVGNSWLGGYLVREMRDRVLAHLHQDSALVVELFSVLQGNAAEVRAQRTRTMEHTEEFHAPAASSARQFAAWFDREHRQPARRPPQLAACRGEDPAQGAAEANRPSQVPGCGSRAHSDAKREGNRRPASDIQVAERADSNVRWSPLYTILCSLHTFDRSL